MLLLAMQYAPANPSLDDLLSQWQDLPRAGRAAFEKDVRERFPSRAEEFEARLHELRAMELEDASVSAVEKPGDTIGRYKLLQLIGEGGFGNVFEAEQTEPVRRRVALKILKPGMDTKQVLARFESERQALSLMNHPNIAKVFDAGATDKGRPYFVMELVHGIPVTEYCDRHKLSTEERLTLFISICQAIQQAHQKGVIHRDIKPSNILVTVHDNVPVPKVIDFGIAKATGARLTDPTLVTYRGFFIGTLEWMSPEQTQMTGEDIDTRSDVYNLGLLLYVLLTGRHPFDRETLHKAAWDEVCRIVREVDPPKPSTCLTTATAEERTEAARRRKCSPSRLSTVLRGDLDWVVMRALEKDRTRRYESAGGLAQDVRRHLAGEPVEARPASTFYRVRKMARRHRLAFAAGTAVLVSLLVGLAVTTVFYFEKRAALDQADRQLYIAHMNLAKQAWDDTHVGRVLELLDQHRPQPGRTDFRGFEWFHLHRLCHNDLLTLTGHTESVMSVVFSPDGKRLASAGYDGSVKVWDVRSGKELLTMPDLTMPILSLAFSPDGKRLASAGQGESVLVRDAASGQIILTLTGHTFPQFYMSSPPETRTGMVSSVAFSHDGKWLASGGAWGSVKVWDATTGQNLLTLNDHLGGEAHVAFSPDGKRLATSGRQETFLRESISGKTTLTLPEGGGLSPYLVFSSDGKRLAKGDINGIVRVWDTTTNNSVRTIPAHAGWAPTRVAFSPDGERLASGGPDKLVKVWDVTTGDELLTLQGHLSEVNTVAFNPDGSRVIAVDHDSKVKVWAVPDGKKLFVLEGKYNNGHLDPAYSVAHSANGKLLASGHLRGAVRLWDASTGQEKCAIAAHTNTVEDVSFSADSKWLASASSDKTVKVWDSTGRAKHTLRGHTDRVEAVTFSPDDSRLASTGRDGTVKLWDAVSGQETLTLKAQSDWLVGVAFSPDGKWLAAASYDRKVQIWHTEKTRPEANLTVSDRFFGE